MGIVVLKRLAEALMDDDNLLTQAFRLHTQKRGFCMIGSVKKILSI
jgi:acyl transferase domain-containing protein